MTLRPAKLAPGLEARDTASLWGKFVVWRSAGEELRKVIGRKVIGRKVIGRKVIGRKVIGRKVAREQLPARRR